MMLANGGAPLNCQKPPLEGGPGGGVAVVTTRPRTFITELGFGWRLQSCNFSFPAGSLARVSPILSGVGILRCDNLGENHVSVLFQLCDEDFGPRLSRAAAATAIGSASAYSDAYCALFPA